jgi:hypothetical protein
MEVNFTLRSKDLTDSIDINDYSAYFPERKNADTICDVSKYVKISSDTKHGVFESKIRRAAEGNDIVLSDKNIQKLGGSQKNVKVEEASSATYWKYSLFHYNLWTFIGFLVAISGVIIDGLLKLGEAGVGIECSKGFIIFLKFISFGLGISGTIILLIKALAKK